MEIGATLMVRNAEQIEHCTNRICCYAGLLFRGSPMVRRFAYLGVLVTSLLGVAAYAQPEGDPSGVWLTQAGDAKVKVSKCGNGICGVIVWLREPIDVATGKPAVDDKTPTRRWPGAR